MYRVERQIEKKWLGGVAVVEELDRLIREAVRQVTIVRFILKSWVVKRSVVTSGGAALVVASFIEIEALIFGEVAFVSKVPFASVKGLVAFPFECLGHSGFFQVQVVSIFRSD